MVTRAALPRVESGAVAGFLIRPKLGPAPESPFGCKNWA